MTEFYKSIPEGIREKLQEYADNARFRDGLREANIMELEGLSSLFSFSDTPEGFDFWYEHYTNNTFPIWSEKHDTFLNP